MTKIRRSIRGAFLAAPAVLLLACGDLGTDPRLDSFMGCPVREIMIGESIAASLSGGECRVESAFTDMYLLDLRADQDILIIDLESFHFDAYLMLYDRDTGELLAENDDINGLVSDARLSGSLPRGRYIIAATSYDVDETGQYVLTVD